MTNHQQKNQSPKIQSKSQIYSDLVFEQMQKLIAEMGEDDLRAKKYKSLCKRAGGIMRTVGLIQFLTYLAAKSQKQAEIHHRYLLDHLREELVGIKVLSTSDTEAFLKGVREQNLPDYMRTTSEVLKLLQWHKRISEVLIAGSVED